MNVSAIISTIIAIVIAVVVFTSLGTTVVNQTTEAQVKCGTVRTASHNETACALENVSATAGTMYNLIELLYPIIGVLIMVAAAFGLSKRG